MNEYTASNGLTVTPGVEHDQAMLRVGGNFNIWNQSTTQALREFFQHERDVELGRWRWPENPEYVVYPPDDLGYVFAVNEAEGFSGRWTRELAINPHLTMDGAAARAYFEAHPERKPWEDAKPGEVWAFVSFGEELAATATSDGRFRFGDDSHLKLSDPVITSARRIWPEDA